MATPNTKIVNIKATIPIRDTTPPIYGVKTNVKMTHSDILKCLCRRAIVEEVLPDGSTVRLTTKNFRDNLAASVKPAKNPVIKKEEPKEEKPVDLIDKITEDADDDDHEPEEAKNVNVTLTFVDGTVINKTGVTAEVVDEEDETYSSDDEEEVKEDIESVINEVTSDEVKKEESTEEEITEDESPVVNTVSEPVDTTVKKKTSSKKSSKKK